MATLVTQGQRRISPQVLALLAVIDTVPRILVPRWQESQPRNSRRNFSTTRIQQSKLGRTPLSIPPGVDLLLGNVRERRELGSVETISERTLTVKGPLGELSLNVPTYVSIEQDLENSIVKLSIDDVDAKKQKAMWGTTWSYLKNYVMGVSEGHTAIMRLVGVGYRASVEDRGQKQQYQGQKFLCLKLGFTHPVEEGIPKGVKVTTPSPTRILLEGTDKESIMSFAGKVRKWRPPEPYKGKGIFINDQTIKLKNKKIK